MSLPVPAGGCGVDRAVTACVVTAAAVTGLDEHDVLAAGGVTHVDAHRRARHVLRWGLGLGGFGFVADDSAYYREYIELRLTDIPAGNDYDLYLYESQSKCQARDALAVSDAAGNASESISYGESFGTSDSGTYFIRVVRYSGWSCDEDYALVINGLD